MKKYYVISSNDEYLSTAVLAETTNLSKAEKILYESAKKEAMATLHLTEKEAEEELKRSAEADAEDLGVSVPESQRSFTVYYGNYSTQLEIIEKDIPGYYIQAIQNSAVPCEQPEEEAYTGILYADLSHALVTAQMLALDEAQGLNEANREIVGQADACWFAADYASEEDGCDFVVRCWDGDDYRIVSKYSVKEEAT